MTTTLSPARFTEKRFASPQVDIRRIATIILGGGQGSRLYPLTTTRCKPAISFGGKYRLIDVALSNAINSGCKQIFVITQFLSCSLHKHICATYLGNNAFSRGFIDLLPAEQRPSANEWFQGTADAVRQNLYYLTEAAADYFLILSGDQLYQMDFQKMLAFAQQTDADAVIATLPITEQDAKRMGIMTIDECSSIVNFTEKPQHQELLDTYKINAATKKRLEHKSNDPRQYLGSMGIYLFKRKVLIDLLRQDPREDFGRHLLPTLIAKGNCFAYLHQGYWEDIGTIRSFYDANIALTSDNPPLDFYNEHYPIIKSPCTLPGARISDTHVSHSIICEGSHVEAEEVTHSILGPRSIVHKGCLIRHSYVMGNDFYSPPARIDRFPEKLQIGENCILQNAIIDKDVYLGKGVRLINKDNLTHYDSDQVFIRDKIIIVTRGASLPDGFTL